ncbi:hypothetical protein BWI17_18135 [Betaproteobacteria bacterium GR16-43]|nr:hypothetical protein BWI17_18135 [Betaproteobacteria bacterium GR16-43]
MSSPAITRFEDPDRTLLREDVALNRTSSGVSWGAIFAGAAAAAALSLILLVLGVGLGLSTVSPWVNEGVSATTFGISSILWITLTSLAASAVGGYIAGRLRTKWVAVHDNEVYFRDTAHGFLAWAVASLLTAALLTSVIGSVLSTGVQAGAAVAGGVAATAAAGTAAGAPRLPDAAKPAADPNPSAYFVDSLFRRDATVNAPAGTPQENAASAAEVARIFMNGIRTGTLPNEDARYVGQVVSQRTGLSQADAEKRVTDTFSRLQVKLKDAEAQAREAADQARKTSAYASLWLFISLLAGAFIASLAATFGGRHRVD